MNIKFERIGQYIHAYVVEGLHDFLTSHKPYFHNMHLNESKLLKNGVVNIPIQNNKIQDPLYDLLSGIVDQYYLVDNSWEKGGVSLYSQSKEHNIKIFHNHYKDNTLACTLYLDPPNVGEGGGLEFFFHERDRYILHPLKDRVYFFPSWALHRPLPQTTEKVRYCLNWGYNCIQRPIHKLTGDKW